MSMKMGSTIGALVVAMAVGIVSCSGETAGGSSSAQGASSSSAASTGSGTGGGGGTMSGTGGSGGTMSGTGGSSTTGTGGSMGYQSCGECANETNGAPMNECKSARDACFAMNECVDIYNCVFFGSSTSQPCTNDEAGACCTLDCYTATSAPQSAIDLYEAMDGCVYCTTCKDLCMTTDYCAVFEPGGDDVCTP